MWPLHCSSSWDTFHSTAVQVHTELFACTSCPRNSLWRSSSSELQVTSHPCCLGSTMNDGEQHRAKIRAIFPPENFYLQLCVKSHWLSVPTPVTSVPLCPSSGVPKVRSIHPSLGLPTAYLGIPAPKKAQNIWLRGYFLIPDPRHTLICLSISWP